MSVLACKLKQGGVTTGIDENGETITYVYEVATTGAAGDELLVKTASGDATIPAYLAAHPIKTALKVKSKNAVQQGGDSKQWDVTVVYGVPRSNGANQPTPDDPEPGDKWSRSLSVNGVEITEMVNKTRSGLPIKNSFGDVYSQGIPRQWYDEEIVYSFSTNTLNHDLIRESRGKVNSTDYTLNITISGVAISIEFPAYTLKLGNVSWSIESSESGTGYFRVNCPFLYRSQIIKNPNNGQPLEIGWDVALVDKGFQYYVSGKPVPSRSEVHLDGAGGKLADGEEHVLFAYDAVETANFATLLEG